MCRLSHICSSCSLCGKPASRCLGKELLRRLRAVRHAVEKVKQVTLQLRQRRSAIENGWSAQQRRRSPSGHRRKRGRTVRARRGDAALRPDPVQRRGPCIASGEEAVRARPLRAKDVAQRCWQGRVLHLRVRRGLDSIRRISDEGALLHPRGHHQQTHAHAKAVEVVVHVTAAVGARQAIGVGHVCCRRRDRVKEATCTGRSRGRGEGERRGEAEGEAHTQ